jgi:hypothetical protein
MKLNVECLTVVTGLANGCVFSSHPEECQQLCLFKKLPGISLLPLTERCNAPDPTLNIPGVLFSRGHYPPWDSPLF